jgi:hypothetical protein
VNERDDGEERSTTMHTADGGTRELLDDRVSGRSRALSWKSTTACAAFSFAPARQFVRGDLHALCALCLMGHAPRFIDEQQERPLTAKIAPNGARMQIRAMLATSRGTAAIIDFVAERCQTFPGRDRGRAGK